MEQDLLGQEGASGRARKRGHALRATLTPVRAGIAAAAATELDEPELSPLFDLTRGGRPARRERQPLPQVIRTQLPVANRKRTALAPLDQMRSATRFLWCPRRRTLPVAKTRCVIQLCKREAH